MSLFFLSCIVNVSLRSGNSPARMVILNIPEPDDSVPVEFKNEPEDTAKSLVEVVI